MIIETQNLTKQFNGQGGCRNICLSVEEGQIFGFLGHNGAGKSTLVKTLVGLLHADSGKAWLLEKPLGDLESRKKIGFLPENFRYHDWMTGFELLAFHASLYKLPQNIIRQRIPEVLLQVGLKDFSKQKIGTYSKGMQQRIGLACALLSDPKLLFLDEPTSALDPLGRREVREIMLKLRAEGKTIFLNSHLLSEVENVCDHVAVIKRGQIVAAGTLPELLQGSVEVTVRIGNLNPLILEAIGNYGNILKVEGQKVTVELTSREKIPGLSELIIKKHGQLYELATYNLLEELFLKLMQEETEAC
ncbi:ABC transporter ATP-binding protein [Bacillota bacterium LX-D]|nr:ABC transporter ATP-binding protein [Bacillota bacterium LX-D]